LRMWLTQKKPLIQYGRNVPWPQQFWVNAWLIDAPGGGAAIEIKSAPQVCIFCMRMIVRLWVYIAPKPITTSIHRILAED
jgi:hypothetical protein